MSAIAAIINSQKRLSHRFDRQLPSHFRVDGHHTFRTKFAPQYLREGLEVWDIGGGKFPYVDAATKKRLNVRSVGLDISASELAAAAPGAYDETIVSDITKFVGRGTADLIICQAVLEHVSNTEAALAALQTILKPGGIALLFVPARNSWFARLNLILPEEFKRRLLAVFHSESKGGQGFPAFYDRCTAAEFRKMAQACGLDVLEEFSYHQSGYFSFLFPAHFLWRLWVLTTYRIDPSLWAETFSMALRKPLPVCAADCEP